MFNKLLKARRRYTEIIQALMPLPDNTTKGNTHATLPNDHTGGISDKVKQDMNTREIDFLLRKWINNTNAVYETDLFNRSQQSVKGPPSKTSPQP